MVSKKDLLKMIYSSDFVFSEQSVYSSTIAVSSSKAKEQGYIFSNENSLSQLYLKNFENTYKLGEILGTSEFMSNFANMACLLSPELKENLENCIFLPKARKCKISLQKCLKNRVSSRLFSNEKIDLKDLSDLLFYSASSVEISDKYINKIKFKQYKRSYPSGGGMYSIDIYSIIYNVEGIKNGIYKYQPISHSLTFIKETVNLENFIITSKYNANLGIYQEIENFSPSVLFVFSNNFTKQRIKYSELSLLLALVDCGCLLQNFSLTASALSNKFCIWAGFKKNSAEKQLELDGIQNHVIMTALLGGKNV